MFGHSLMSKSLVTPWTAARQAPLSMGFSRRACSSGSPCPPPGGLPDPGIELVSLTSPALQVDSVDGLLITGSGAGAQLQTGARGLPKSHPP